MILNLFATALTVFIFPFLLQRTSVLTKSVKFRKDAQGIGADLANCEYWHCLSTSKPIRWDDLDNVGIFCDVLYCPPLPATAQTRTGLAMPLSAILLHRLTTAILSSAKMAATGASIASDSEHPLRGWTRPEEWSNDDRMHFLMSPYPPGKFPSLEDPKFKFWSRLIHSSSCEMRKITFSLSDVNERFERNSLRPKCLREVVQLMERQGLVVQLERYEQKLREQTDGLVSWSAGLLARPLSWAWRYMTDASGSVPPIHGRFIIVDRLQVSVRFS